jgi:hypothetical protein
VTGEVANGGRTAATGSVGSAMAHVAVAEDGVVQLMMQGKPPLYTTEWLGRTGISDPQMFNTEAWKESVQVEPEALAAYRDAVFAATGAYVQSLSESDLDRSVDLSAAGLGTQTIGWMLVNLVAGHLSNLTGEISTLKGLQGLTGYPF